MDTECGLAAIQSAPPRERAAGRAACVRGALTLAIPQRDLYIQNGSQ